MTTESALAARIRAEMAELGRPVERTERLLAKSAQDEDYLDVLCAFLERTAP